MQGATDPSLFRNTLDSVFAAPAYRWTEMPGPIATLRDWWRRLGDWLEALRSGNPAVFRVLVILLLLALLLFIGHAAWVVWQTVRAGAGSDTRVPGMPRVEQRDADWYYREADRLAEAGRIRDGLQLAFVGLALTLDAQGLLHYHPSKTPAECAREASLAGQDRERLAGLVQALYACAFGGKRCETSDYRRWRTSGIAPWNAAAH